MREWGGEEERGRRKEGGGLSAGRGEEGDGRWGELFPSSTICTFIPTTTTYSCPFFISFMFYFLYLSHHFFPFSFSHLLLLSALLPFILPSFHPPFPIGFPPIISFLFAIYVISPFSLRPHVFPLMLFFPFFSSSSPPFIFLAIYLPPSHPSTLLLFSISLSFLPSCFHI